MPSPTFSVSTEINAAPALVFAYVSDLAKHGEWAANDLRVEPVDAAPLGVGKKYRSSASVRGREFHADLVVTAYNAPTVFAFSGTDETASSPIVLRLKKAGRAPALRARSRSTCHCRNTCFI